jgi:hypothetical protein
MKTQTIEQMIEARATPEEAQKAMKVWKLLLPGLKVKRNGRVNTEGGDKTPLGLYRTILKAMRED